MVTEIFSSMVFDDRAMEARLPKEIYKTLQRTIKLGKHLDLGVANVVANAMKDWAIEKGATHFTHWFQPLTGVTAEKHDSFISPMPSPRTGFCIFPPSSAPMAAKHWTRRPPCSVPWKPSTGRPSVSCAFSAMPM